MYLPFENQDEVTQILQQIPQVNFKQYSPEVSDSDKGNVVLRKANYAGFKKDLQSASGVICNSGFELISECLHIGLPILTKPLNGQMEQHSNALALEQLNYAKVVKSLSLTSIKQWCLADKTTITKPLPDVAGAIADAIVNAQWQNPQFLSDKLWAQ